MIRRSSLLGPLVVLAASSSAACLDPTVIGGEGGGSGDGGSSGIVTAAATTVSVVTGGGGGTPGAVAAYGSEVEGVQLCVGDPCPPTDDMLFLFVDSRGNSCSAPHTPIHTSSNAWQMTIGVPTWAQEVGTYTMDDSFLWSYGAAEVGETQGSTVGVTGGLGATGTFEILSIDDTHVRFFVDGTGIGGEGYGEHVAARCGATSLEPEGIALAGQLVPRSTGEGGGAAEPSDPDAITIVVGSAVPACSAPLASTCAGDDWQIAVSLPPEYLVPGEYSLADPRIGAANCAALPKFLGGTIEIVDIDETSLIVRFADVVDHVEALEQDLRIARCP